MVEEVCYKPEGHGLNSRWGHWFFPSRCNMVPGFIQPVTEMSTERFLGVKHDRLVN
jgi:hypothetical protein